MGDRAADSWHSVCVRCVCVRVHGPATQLSLVQQSAAAKLEAARLTATQQLAAALKLQSQQAQQQLEWQVSGLNEHWSSRCKAAEAAVEKEGALRAHAESEVCAASCLAHQDVMLVLGLGQKL